MHFVCVSASNIRHAKDSSTSLNACRLVEQILMEKAGSATTVDIIALVDYELKPCHGCGTCLDRGECVTDQEFNRLYGHLKRGEGFFIVSPHYTPIPAKLCMVLEKIEQLAFLPRFHDETRLFPLYGRPVGLIAHGGGTEDLIHWYQALVLDTIANALSWPVEMDVVGLDQERPRGIVFPVKVVRHDPEAAFPIQEYDWKDIRRRLEPLVQAVVESVRRKGKGVAS
jgi:hypothetical protein